MNNPFLKSKPLSILLAEDDADDRELFIEAFSIVDPTIQVATVDDGERLMEHLNESTTYPDCIFLDLNMPRKNGKECLQEIKGNKKIQDIPVVIYTTSVNSKDVDETFDRGASHFIRKPNSFKELTQLLEIYITSAIRESHQQMLRGKFVLNSR
jgi:CheY-like chemotaxis protein